MSKKIISIIIIIVLTITLNIFVFADGSWGGENGKEMPRGDEPVIDMPTVNMGSLASLQEKYPNLNVRSLKVYLQSYFTLKKYQYETFIPYRTDNGGTEWDNVEYVNGERGLFNWVDFYNTHIIITENYSSNSLSSQITYSIRITTLTDYGDDPIKTSYTFNSNNITRNLVLNYNSYETPPYHPTNNYIYKPFCYDDRLQDLYTDSFGFASSTLDYNGFWNWAFVPVASTYQGSITYLKKIIYSNYDISDMSGNIIYAKDVIDVFVPYVPAPLIVSPTITPIDVNDIELDVFDEMPKFDILNVGIADLSLYITSTFLFAISRIPIYTGKILNIVNPVILMFVSIFTIIPPVVWVIMFIALLVTIITKIAKKG